MLSKPEFFAYAGRTGLLLSSASLVASLLAACAGNPPSPAGSGAGEAPTKKAAPQPVARATVQPCQAATPTSAAAPAASDEVVRMLAYADRVRTLPPPELAQEASRLGSTSAPFEQLQLALVLSQLRQPPELIRAQELLTRLLGNSEAQALHPLARLLAMRLGEQRRVEEQLDKQNQQVRDVQRRLDQTHERLEALKAIERSLTGRPAAPSPAPSTRARPLAP